MMIFGDLLTLFYFENSAIAFYSGGAERDTSGKDDLSVCVCFSFYLSVCLSISMSVCLLFAVCLSVCCL